MNQGIFFLDGSLLIKSFFELELKENLKLISKKLGDAPHLKKKNFFPRQLYIYKLKNKNGIYYLFYYS